MHGTCPDTQVPSQLRRGTVEYCVLALLRGGARDGFESCASSSEVDGLVTSEGTIYPLLTRLRKEQLVTTFWRESESGPPRRYYELTDGAGRRWRTSPRSGPGSGTLSMRSYEEEG